MARSPRTPDDDEQSWRTTMNLLAVIVLLLVFGSGYYLMGALATSKKALQCIEAGRRNCGELTVVK